MPQPDDPAPDGRDLETAAPPGTEERARRLSVLGRVRERGEDPYPAHYHRTHMAQEAVTLWQDREAGGVEPPAELRLAGRITNQRGMGAVTFMDLRDESGRIQLFFRRNDLSEDAYALLKDYDLGDIIGVSGALFRTRTGEITLRVTAFTMLAKAVQPPPEKWHGLVDVEKRYRQRYLDLMANEEARQIFITRTKAVRAMRRFLDDRGFMEVETSMLNPSAGGAAARPFITYHNTLERNLYLRIATELHLKRLIIGGFERVYEIGRIFRNEGVSTKHNPEFTMLESYQAYADYYDVMQMVEEMLAAVAEAAIGSATIMVGDTPVDLAQPWQRMTLRDAIIQYCGVDFQDYPNAERLREKLLDMGVAVDPAAGFGKLVDTLLSDFVEPNLVQPTFLLDYPEELSPLAKRKAEDPRLVERFEGFIGGMELANAFSELNDPVDQRERFAEQLRLREAGDEETEMPDEDFLVALEHGMPPTGGLGVGIDRLVMLLTGQQSIREVILFPQLKTR